MIPRMRGNGNGNGGGIVLDDPLLWVIGGTAAVIALYQLTKRSLTDQVGPVAPKEAPTSFVDLNAVATRFGQVRELWTMGYLNPTETLEQLTGLLTAIETLISSEKISPAGAQELTARIQALIDDVGEYQQLQAGAVPA